jgi:peptidoglycan/xylan/chitin deacetylase (PgdA/CDA1 family)
MDLKNLWAPHTGAISLTFDDGTPNHLEKVVPALDSRGLRGTFYLFPREENWKERYTPWTKVAATGHEIGNHSLSHPCSNNLFGTRGGLEDMNLEDIEKDILAAQRRLVEIAPHQKEWTFAYPCYNTFVGAGATRRSYVPIIAKHFVAGRASGEYGFGNRPDLIDLSCICATGVERMSAAEMIGIVEEITGKHHWAVLVFHEIDGQRLTVASHDFHLLLEHLVRRRDSVLTAPVVEVARKIRAFREVL